MPKRDHRSQMAWAWLHIHAALGRTWKQGVQVLRVDWPVYPRRAEHNTVAEGGNRRWAETARQNAFQCRRPMAGQRTPGGGIMGGPSVRNVRERERNRDGCLKDPSDLRECVGHNVVDPQKNSGRAPKRGVRAVMGMKMTSDDANDYVLGHSDRELERLRRQAQLVNPITRQYLIEAGIASGMSVLDIGSGAGDVAFLAADLVGQSGKVVGVDRSHDALALARSRAMERSPANVSFHESQPVVGDGLRSAFRRRHWPLCALFPG